ncbi:WXG100-like domain-containing protein, partial [Spirilliplanes yamanashiensis]|uniref:WXG100-like domain-containing protein n=2 Tax=Spirilliplanes yamanashiensis TaxID=42233 RepID=UPI0019503338
MPDLHIDPEWDWAYNLILYTSGEQYPKAWPTWIRSLDGLMKSYSSALDNAGDNVSTLGGNVFNVLTGDTANAFYDATRDLMNDIPNIQAGLDQLSNAVLDFALQTEHTQYSIHIAMYATIIDIFSALVSATPWTIPFHIAAGALVVRALIQMRRLRMVQNVVNKVQLPPMPKFPAIPKLTAGPTPNVKPPTPKPKPDTPPPKPKPEAETPPPYTPKP